MGFGPVGKAVPFDVRDLHFDSQLEKLFYIYCYPYFPTSTLYSNNKDTEEIANY